MEIFIWGTEKKGRAVKKVCDKMGWSVKAFIDNDETKLGNLEGAPVIAPDSISFEPEEDIQIWIATGAEEVYRQAKKISNNVLEWKYIRLMLQSQTERPPYPEIQLNEQNIYNCRLVSDREIMLKQLADDSKNWKMAEIGVAFGDFSEQIIKICSPKKLYLIDCWDSERFGAGAACVRDKFKHEIDAGIVEIMQGYSTQKLEEFADGELDWAYIDTVHDYETTKKELELCDRKVKSGGYICGHDYTKFNVYSRYDYGVYDAVNEFAVHYEYEFIYLTMETHGLQSYCLRKIGERM